MCRRAGSEHKPGPVVTVAVARELVGFLWAALHPDRGAVLGIRRPPTDVEQGGWAALGAGTTAAGVAVGTAYMAGSTLPARN